MSTALRGRCLRCSGMTPEPQCTRRVLVRSALTVAGGGLAVLTGLRRSIPRELPVRGLGQSRRGARRLLRRNEPIHERRGKAALGDDGTVA
jgi:hypothetical protein